MQNLLSLLMAFLLALFSFLGIGCATTKHVDGTTTTRVDTESAVVLLQTSITLAESAYVQWIASQGQMEAQAWSQGLETRKANVDMLRGILKDVLAAQAAKATAAAAKASQ